MVRPEGLREIGHGLDRRHVSHDGQTLHWVYLVDNVVDFCPQRVGLDHHVGVERLSVRPGNDGLGGHEDQASVAGDYWDAEPAGGRPWEVMNFSNRKMWRLFCSMGDGMPKEWEPLLRVNSPLSLMETS